MHKTLSFYFDLSSPTAYLAHTQLKRITSTHQIELAYEPMLLGAVLKATNNVAPATVPAKGKYMLLHDLPRFIKRYQVPFKMNPHFPINSLTLMRGCFAAKKMGCFETYVDHLFQAMWTQGLNLGEEGILRAQLTQAGIDADQLMALTEADEIKAALKDNTASAIARGVFGAPTMFIGHEMFFGQDRLDFVEEALKATVPTVQTVL